VSRTSDDDTDQAPADAIELRVVDPGGDDARWCIREYFAFLGSVFPEGFDSDSDPERDRARFGEPDGAFLVAFLDDEPVGCGALQRLGEDSGEIKRMWVAEQVRRRGLGARILAALEDEAAARGWSTVYLDTNDALTPAITMYRSRGYEDIERYNDNPYARLWFRKQLAG
jgi:GNAT superfamily N-acetyltransferase